MKTLTLHSHYQTTHINFKFHITAGGKRRCSAPKHYSQTRKTANTLKRTHKRTYKQKQNKKQIYTRTKHKYVRESTSNKKRSKASNCTSNPTNRTLFPNCTLHHRQQPLHERNHVRMHLRVRTIPPQLHDFQKIGEALRARREAKRGRDK